MDELAALERGDIVPPEAAPVGRVVCSAVVARDWAQTLGLRQGNTRGPASTALVPVVDAWAVARGMTGPGYRDVGRGLMWAGLVRRMKGEHGQQYLVLHRDDAAKLWRLVRAAWAPGCAPGDPRGRQNLTRRAPRRRRLHPPPDGHTRFHEELARDRRQRPLVDSVGRVWPSASVAARALRGNRKAVDNARRALAIALEGRHPVQAGALASAIKKGAAWRGRLWRHLTPEEVRAVPVEHLSGHPLPWLVWSLVCPKCGAHPPGSGQAEE